MGAVRNITEEQEKYREFSEPWSLNDTELAEMVTRAAGGDIEVFGKLYNIFLSRIYRYVFYQVRDKMTAEDLTEEIFMKAWKALNKYNRESGKFSSWLYRIAHNHVIDYFRTRRQDVELDEEIPAAGSFVQEIEAEMMQKDLAEAMSYLPPQRKQVLILKFIEGLGDPEIANIMKKRQGTVRVLQTRSLAALRQILNREESKCRLNYLKPLVNA